MLARGIRSYHRPARMDQAVSLASQGAAVLAGGTRLLARLHDVPNILDLSSLSLSEIRVEDGDLVLGSMVTLQEVMDSPLTYAATSGLLPEACRAQSASWMIRSMATLGGESVHASHDSEVVAALLALNTIYTIAGPAEPIETPALRFLKNPREDLSGSGIVQALMIPGVPDGTALERAAVLPSAPSLVSVAVTISFLGDVCTRARIALTGLETAPARVLEAEARVEGTLCDTAALERCADQIVTRAPFREDAHAPASYRRAVARVLALRALHRAMDRARGREQAPTPPRLRPTPPLRFTTAPAYFTSGRIEVTINGDARRPEVEARTTLLELLRREGFWGVKHGCETGECGACAVLLDGRPVVACLTLALRAHGRSVLTVEGLGTPDDLHPLQTAFIETGAIQCGFCTPAMEICAKSLLDAVGDPTESEVRDALGGCLCRCTGYVKPVQAVLQAAGRMRS